MNKEQQLICALLRTELAIMERRLAQSRDNWAYANAVSSQAEDILREQQRAERVMCSDIEGIKAALAWVEQQGTRDSG